MIDWDKIRETLVAAIDKKMREDQAAADLAERLNIGRYVLRQRERLYGLDSVGMCQISRKDIPGFLDRLQRPGGENTGNPPTPYDPEVDV